MLIDKNLIHFNYSSRRSTPIRYIVIHDTGNSNAGANALNHFLYFGRCNRNASAHYFVDDNGVVQIIEDAHAAWHCGDGRGRYGITNSNSIGIEICVNSDGDMDKSLEFARKLVRELMKFYQIPLKNVVRHFDASHKICPRSMASDNWKKWWKFKESL